MFKRQKKCHFTKAELAHLIRLVETEISESQNELQYIVRSDDHMRDFIKKYVENHRIILTKLKECY